MTQCVLSAMAGNVVVIPGEYVGADVAEKIQKFLLSAGFARQQIIISKENILTICTSHELDFMVTDDEDIAELRKALAARAGARIPVLSSCDAAQLHFIERVVSEDTTASGGNAKLLAGV